MMIQEISHLTQGERTIGHLLLFPEDWASLQVTNDYYTCEPTHKPPLVGKPCFTFICMVGGEERRGEGGVPSCPLLLREEKTLDQAPFHSHGSYYGRLRNICSATNNGARPRASDPRPIPSPAVPPPPSPPPLALFPLIVIFPLFVSAPKCMRPARFPAAAPRVPAPSAVRTRGE